MTRSDRAAAYAELLSALLAVRADPATARFDAELAAAEARGDLDGPAARSLRWWQRESLRSVTEHLGAVLPDLLASIEAADAAAEEATRESADAWAAATQRHRPPEDGVPAAFVPDDDRPGSGAAEASAAPAGPSTITPFPVAAPSPEGPAPVGPPSAHVTDHGASRQRLLVAGLTVLSDGAGPADPPRTT